MKGARALTPLEIQAVCAAFDGEFAVRNRTLFLLCANIGTRISEALNLNVGDVLQNGKVVSVLYLRRQTVKGKNEGAALTLPSGARNALINFIAWKKKRKESMRRDAPLFVSRIGRRLSRKQAYKNFRKVYEKLGLEGQVTTHSPRKTYAKMVYENSGKDLMMTQRALRHTDIQTTLCYLDSMSDDLTAVMPNFDFDEGDERCKTSPSKIVTLRKPATPRARRGDRK